MGNLFGSVLLHLRILYSIQANCVLLFFFEGGWGSIEINTLFSYIAKETIDPHYALGVFPQPLWGRANIN